MTVVRGAPGILAVTTFFLAGAATVLVLGLLVFLLRARRLDRARAARITALDTAMGLWLVVILAVTVVPIRAAGYLPPIGLIPFLDAFQRIANGESTVGGEAFDVINNIILFLPLGILAGVRWGRSWRTVFILLAIALSTSIETTQALQDSGRFASATDILTNTVGAAIGFSIGLRIRRRRSDTGDD